MVNRVKKGVANSKLQDSDLAHSFEKTITVHDIKTLEGRFSNVD